LPFFVPAYIPGNKISIYGEAKIKGLHPGIKPSLEEALREHSDSPGNISGIFSIEGDGLRQVLRRQQDFRNFPAPLEALKGVSEYYDFVPGARIYEKGNLTVDTIALNHPGNSIAYKFTERKADGSYKIFVFATDNEPDANGYDERLVGFCRGANLLVADGQYEPRDSELKINPFMPGWGHSDYKTNLNIAYLAGVEELENTHHEPKMGDDYYDSLDLRAKELSEKMAQEHGRRVKVGIAKEGRWFEL